MEYITSMWYNAKWLHFIDFQTFPMANGTGVATSKDRKKLLLRKIKQLATFKAHIRDEIMQLLCDENCVHPPFDELNEIGSCEPSMWIWFSRQSKNGKRNAYRHEIEAAATLMAFDNWEIISGLYYFLSGFYNILQYTLIAI